MKIIRAWYIFLSIVEIRTKIISVAVFLLGTLFALEQQGSFMPGMALLMLTAVLLVDMGTTAFNSFFDYYRGVDTAESNREADKVLVSRQASMRTAFRIAAVLYAAAAVAGFALAMLTSWWVVVVGALCMLVGFLYTGGPIPIAFTPVGEPFAGVFLGSVLFVLSYYIQAGSWGTDAVLAGIPLACIIATVLAVNNACDAVGDAAAGRKTLAVLLPRKLRALPAVIWYIFALVAGAQLLYSGILPSLAGIMVLVAGGACGLPLWIGMQRRGYSHEQKSANMKAVLRFFLCFCTAYVVGLCIGVRDLL